MFKGLGNLGDIAGLLKQAGQMKERMEALKDELGNRIVESSAGGGMVTVRANGRQEIVSIAIEEEVFNSGDKRLVEDLVAAASNAALAEAKLMLRNELVKITGGLNIDLPGIL